jgi:hypothetical protein
MSKHYGGNYFVRHKAMNALTLATAAAVASSVILISNLGGAASAYAVSGPGCITQECPTPTPTASVTPTSTPTDTPTDGSDDSGAIQTVPPVAPTDSLTDAPTDSTGVNADPGAPSDDASVDANNPDRLGCDESGWVKLSSLQGKYIYGVGASQSDWNNSSRTATVTFLAQASATIGVSLSASINTSINGLIVEAKADFGVTLSTSVTAGISNSISTTVPAHDTMNATYGVWRRRFNGTTYWQYSNCALSSHAFTAYAPYQVGWYLWEG